MRSGEEIKTVDQLNTSVEGKWILIPILPFTPHEQLVILKAQFLLNGRSLQEKEV